MADFIKVTALPDNAVLRINKNSITRYYDRSNDGITYCSVWVLGMEKPIAVAELASLIDQSMSVDVVGRAPLTEPGEG